VDSKPIRKRSATRAVTRIASDTGVLDIGAHDLRGMLATGLGEMGVADELIERVLNHAPRRVAGKHYNHAKLFEGLRTALEARSERVRGILEGAGPVSNGLPLRITGIQHDPAPQAERPNSGRLTVKCMPPARAAFDDLTTSSTERLGDQGGSGFPRVSLVSSLDFHPEIRPLSSVRKAVAFRRPRVRVRPKAIERRRFPDESG
jgi:hypothetical protein